MLKLVACYQKNERKIQSLVANNANGIFKPRVFNDGRGTNKSLGTYKTSGKKSIGTRKKGSKVNLQDSNQLFNSIIVGTKGKDVVLGIRKSRKGEIDNVRLSKILETSKKLNYGEIFSLNEKEAKLAIDASEDKIIDVLHDCANKLGAVTI